PLRSRLFKRARRALDPGYHGLVPWSVTLVSKIGENLPRSDATALCRGRSRWFLPTRRALESRCHGLVPRLVTLVSTLTATLIPTLRTTAQDRGIAKQRKRGQ